MTNADTDAIAITVPLTVDPQRLCDLVVGSFEGGSTSWLHRAEYEGSNPVETGERVIWWGRKGLYKPGFAMRVFFDDPEGEEGEGKGERVITFEDLKAALVKMAQDAPSHFADFLLEEGDADTDDAFMQFAVLGAITYG